MCSWTTHSLHRVSGWAEWSLSGLLKILSGKTRWNCVCTRGAIGVCVLVSQISAKWIEVPRRAVSQLGRCSLCCICPRRGICPSISASHSDSASLDLLYEPGQKKRNKQKPSFPWELTEEAVCSVMSEMSGEIKHNTRVSPTRDDTSFD